MYLMLAGYGDPFTRGQIRSSPPQGQDRLEAHIIFNELGFVPYINGISCIPIANLIIGIFHVLEGLFRDGSHLNVSHVKWQFKIMRIGIGLLEITLVGGWLVHGLATLYFYSTSPTREPT